MAAGTLVFEPYEHLEQGETDEDLGLGDLDGDHDQHHLGDLDGDPVVLRLFRLAEAGLLGLVLHDTRPLRLQLGGRLLRQGHLGQVLTVDRIL